MQISWDEVEGGATKTFMITDRQAGERECAMTGLEITSVIAVVVIAVTALILTSAGSLFTGGGTRGGLIPAAVEETGYSLITDGDIFGFEDTCGPFEGVDLVCVNPNPGKMGSLFVTVRLITGDMGAIDMEKAEVVFSSVHGKEVLAMKSSRPLERSGWTITGKSHVLPHHEADEDNILEPNELFEILIYPSVPLADYTKFTVTINYPGGVPLKITRTVPPQIRVHRVVDLN
ncbi:MAG: hypothetical protein U9N40_01975 [Euryarchaeota archaeon]|nr:hypothetical protein [Euryarchaeota archaeon]